MWKKEEGMPAQPPFGTVVSAETPRAPVARTGHATIGPSIVIRGEVSGNEDLLIQGQVDGAVALDLHSVTVGGGGRVKANITGRIITIEGEVEGDLRAQEQIILRGSAKVQGDLKAPRVVLEDGASFRGLVDMGAREAREAVESRRPEKAASGPGATAGPAVGGSTTTITPKPDGAAKAPAAPAARPEGRRSDAAERGVGT